MCVYCFPSIIELCFRVTDGQDDQAPEEHYHWEKPKWALPARLAAIVKDNPCRDREVRRRITQILPQVQDLPTAPPPPNVSGRRTSTLDPMYASWQNRVIELLKMLMLLQMQLTGDVPTPVDGKEVPQTAELMESTFALAVNLLRQIAQARKGLIDRRLRASPKDDESLITAEDIKLLEKQEKFQRAFHARMPFFKGKSGKGQFRRPYQPFKGGKGAKGRTFGGRGQKPFSFLQVVPKPNAPQAS